MTIGKWAMHKDFFNEIGGLDEEMKVSGGDNIDISIRVSAVLHNILLAVVCGVDDDIQFVGYRSIFVSTHKLYILFPDVSFQWNSYTCTLFVCYSS